MRSVYTAESQVLNLRQLLREMAIGLGASPHLAYRLARKDVKNAYAASALGALWDLLEPLVLAGIFYYLMRTPVLSSANLGMPASVFVVYGMMIYATYSESLILSTELMNTSRGLLGHVRIPAEGLILSVGLRVGFSSLFRIAVMAIISFVTGAFSIHGFIAFIICFPLIIFWGMAPGILLAPFNVIYADIGRLVRLVLLPLRFVAPVIYAIPKGTFLEHLQVVSPVSMALNDLRSLAVLGKLANPGWTAIHLVFLSFVAFVGWIVFRISIPVISERSQ